MDKTSFRTLFKNEGLNALCMPEYERGRIAGIMYACCFDDEEDEDLNKGATTVSEECDGELVTVRCTEERYTRFKRLMEDGYPGLCEFNVVFDWEKPIED